MVTLHCITIKMYLAALWIFLMNIIHVSSDFHLGLFLPFTRSSRTKTHDHRGSGYAHAFTTAVDLVNNSSRILPNHKLKFNWTDTTLPDTGLRAIYQKYVNGPERADVFIGPAYNCTAPARISQAFNIPMISYYCLENTGLYTKDAYPLFIRTYLTANNQVPEALFAVLNKLKWKRIGIIYEEDEHWKKLKKTIVSKSSSYDVDVVGEEMVPHADWFNYFSKGTTKAYVDRNNSLARTKDALKQLVHEKVKIFVILTSNDVTMDVVAEAHGLKLAGSAEAPHYVFIGFQLSLRYNRYRFRNNKVSQEDETRRRLVTKQGARSLLLISLTAPEITEKYKEFQAEVEMRARIQDPFYYANIYTADLRVSPLGSALYDAVLQYARTLDRLLKRNVSVTPQAVVEEFRSQPYESIEGNMVRFLTADGTIEADLKLLHLQQDVTINTVNKIPPTEIGSINFKYHPPIVDFFNASKGLIIHWPWGTENPIDTMNCENDNVDCDTGEDVEKERRTILVAVSTTVAAVFLLVLVFLLLLVVRQRRRERRIKRMIWEIDISDIVFDRKVSTHSRDSGVTSMLEIDNIVFSKDFKHHSWSKEPLFPVEQREMSVLFSQNAAARSLVGTYKSGRVFVKILPKVLEISRLMQKELGMLCRIKHENLNPFIGLGFDASYVWVVMQLGSKGTLQEIFTNQNVTLNYSFVLSLVFDIAKGMTYLHNSDIKSHGNLKSANCIVDNRWVLKITDFGIPEIRSRQLRHMSNNEDEKKYTDLFWRAPELLRQTNAPQRGTQKGDVYSFAILLEEFHTLKLPYSKHTEHPKQIVEHVANGEHPPYRPLVIKRVENAETLFDLMKFCWREAPEDRPDFGEIKYKVECAMIKSGLTTDICDNMIMLLENYSSNLETIVSQRTRELRDEKQKTDALLDRMLPRSVAEQLKRGEQVQAECYPSVTIYFSDIVQFTALCAESTPMQVVDLLSDLYSLFDGIILEYHVYKVETIGDAYMVVSGLPTKNGKLHASEISCMALDILDSVATFKVRHKPEHELQVRIGIHTGPVVAGVVGTTMPRYCLFGDTVNTASRMESNGQALRVHVSSSTKEILDELGGFNIVQREEQVYLKGKGHCTTYWLNSASVDVPRWPRKLSKKALEPLFHTAATRKHSAPFRVRSKVSATPRFSVS